MQFIEKNPQTISAIEDTSMNFAVPEQSIAQQICNIEYQALEATQSIVLANHDDDNDHEDCDDDIEGTFLYQITKHSKSTENACTFLPTSRSVERMFSFTKDCLDRNKEMRIEVLNSILCLHDQENEELAHMWKE